jgi:hypothetical protein
MTIDERPCARCAIRRTVRLGTWGWVCFNCGLHVPAGEGGVSTDRASERAEHPFTPAEIVRLERYRAAVAAGLYSDWPPRTLRA